MQNGAKKLCFSLEEVVALTEATGRDVVNRVATLKTSTPAFRSKYSTRMYFVFATYSVYISLVVLTGPKPDHTRAFCMDYDTPAPSSSCNESFSSDTDISQRSRSIHKVNLFSSESGESTGLSDSAWTSDDRPLASVLSASSKPSQLPTSSKRIWKKFVPTKELLNRYELIRLFVTGPIHWENNPHQWLCRNCKRNYSMKSRGFAQIFAHNQSKEHLLRDQRYGHSCPGAPVYDRKGRVLRGEALDKAKGKFLSIPDVPELAPKRLFVGQCEIPMSVFDLSSKAIFAAQVAKGRRLIGPSDQQPLRKPVQFLIGRLPASSVRCWECFSFFFTI